MTGRSVPRQAVYLNLATGKHTADAPLLPTRGNRPQQIQCSIQRKSERSVDNIRKRPVSVEVEGRTDFVKELPNVTNVESEGNRLNITLADGADPQELLRSLMDRARVQAFEVKVPSLHEIFVDLVGKSDAEAA